MDAVLNLADQRPVVALHLASALAAIVIGAVLLWGRKGSTAHRWLGWSWVVMMATATVSSAFMLNHRAPNLLGFTPIHLLTVLVAVQLPLGVLAARRGRVTEHRQRMKGLYLGACVIAGVFTLLPGRFLGTLLWRDLLGVMA
jgi:uncharacterized membrane protein